MTEIQRPSTGRTFGRILYSSLIDVSLPYGPGVNERGFLKDMLARTDHNLFAVIPKPSRGMPKELEGLNVKFIPSWGSVRSQFGWIQVRAIGSLMVLRAIESFRPDLIVMRSGALSLPHFFASRTSTVPYALKTTGDGTFAGFYAGHPVGRVLRNLNRTVFDVIMRGAACIDVASAVQRDTLASLYPALACRIHVVDNGVDLQHFLPANGSGTRERLGFGGEDVVIGYVGNAPMQRGGKEVMDAVAKLRPMKCVKGLIVGDSGEAEHCREYGRAHGVSDLVVVYGEADYAEVPDLMKAMDVGLSILRPRERLAAEQKVRQYLASGLCVVGTAGSNDFLYGLDFARVVQSTDPAEVTGAVAELIQDGRERLSSLGQRARAFAESNLSLAARNDQRIRHWEAAYSRQ